MTLTATRTLPERALEILRRVGNPFRNYFARNPDDEVCSRYHVPELYAREREQLLGVVDLYRYSPNTHSEVVPVLGNKGSGKTHLLHSIKHGAEGEWQLLVTPGTYQRDVDFLEYLLFQLIDTLLGGGKQKNTRPLDYVGEMLIRGAMSNCLKAMSANERLDLFPTPGLARWTRMLGLGTGQANDRAQWLVDSLSRPMPLPFQAGGIRRALKEVQIAPQMGYDTLCRHIEKTEAHNTAGLMRRAILGGFARAVILEDESELAGFLTYGFAELEFNVRPSRQDLVLALFKALMGVLNQLRIPVVVAFDQLEDLLLARRSDDAHRTAESFFAGIVQAMHHLDGISFLIFAERGLWNRFVPSLDGYIQDRLNNPIHLPQHGTLQALRLEAPPPDLVRRVVEARLRPALEQLPDFESLPGIFPFQEEQVERIARTEPTLRDMLQQYRHLFDRLVYNQDNQEDKSPTPASAPTNRIAADVLPETTLESMQDLPPVIKSVVVVESPTTPVEPVRPTVPARQVTPAVTPATPAPTVPSPTESVRPRPSLSDLWDQEVRTARRKLEPEGALTGATRELQAGLGLFLTLSQEHGIKVGPWRLSHVVPEWTFGDHPTYGSLTLAHWVCGTGQPWKVGIGLFLGRGPAKPRDLGTKLSAMEADPPMIDHLILLRPEDDLSLTGKSKTLWQDAERRGWHTRIEPVSLDSFAVLYGFPRLIACLKEALPEGQPLPNLADLFQDKCEKLLEQVCMPVQN